MKTTRVIVFLWLAWVVIVMGFQALATARLKPVFPDRALDWTTKFTDRGYQKGHIYLLEPFMNNQVAWDSEYYLAIAVGGYDDPHSPHLTSKGVVTGLDSSVSKGISLSYAFFPFYPLMIRILAFPLQILGLNLIATATLAGVIVSALGALLGMLALFDLTRDRLGKEGALRAVFYLIIFPTGFYMVQVYSEGLFVGLAVACLAMLKRNQWLLATLLSIAATMTRAVGVLLIIPMLVTWFRSGQWNDLHREGQQRFPRGISLRPFGYPLLALSPLITFLIWKFSYLGRAFDYVQAYNYERGFLSLDSAFSAWAQAVYVALSGDHPQTTAYYLTEFFGITLGVVACAVTLKSDPEIAMFSMAVVLVSWGSGPAQGMLRYVLAAPAVFIALARWGNHPVFDRAWTILSILLMGLLAMLFAFNLWVA